jgi:hypothetical protein
MPIRGCRMPYLRAIERVCHRAHKGGRRRPWEYGVGVQRDDVAHIAQRPRVARHHRERVAGSAAQIAVELRQLAALSLPSHPRALGRVPEARPVEQKKGVPLAGHGGITLVESLDAADGGVEYRAITFPRRSRRVREVAEQREMQPRIAIGEKLHFEMVERFAHGLHGSEQCRDDDRGARRRRDAGLLEIELREDPRRQKQRDELMDDVDREVVRRDDGEGQYDPLRGQSERSEEQERHAEEQQGDRGDAPEVHRVGVRQGPPVQRQRPRRTESRGGLEQRTAIAEQIVTHVGRARVGLSIHRRRDRCPLREIERALCHLPLLEARPLGDVLDDVTVQVARPECRADVVARGITPQNRLDGARHFDELGPVEARDRPQAGDAVRHHHLRQRLALIRPCDRLLRTQAVFGDPLLQPHERREIRLVGAELLEESRHERRRQRGMAADESGQRARERRRSFVARVAQALRPPVRGVDFFDPLHRPQRHPPDVLHQAEAQHRRDRPQLAGRERGAALEFAHEELDVVHVHVPLGVADQSDRHFVDARIARQCPRRQLGQLLVVAARHARADLP